jgi:hypothetical protein
MILIEAHHNKSRAIRIGGKGKFAAVAAIHHKAKPAPASQQNAAIGEAEIIQTRKGKILKPRG